MRKILLSCLAMICLQLVSRATGDEDSAKIAQEQMRAYRLYIDSVEKTLHFETGKVILPGGAVSLQIPEGFRFLDSTQSKYVLTDLWGNPSRQDVLGMLLPPGSKLSSDQTYTFVISFDAIGFVKDKDADDINYDDLLKNMQEEEVIENARRRSLGYDAIHMVGWAQPPFYDKNNKVLHWAKELKFGEDAVNTLNYEVRILGRRGVLSLNAIGTMAVLPAVKKDIEKVLAIPSFTIGNRYQDFDSKTDDVAAWTVGGLVAGKILAKAGAFKFLKIIIIGIAALFGGAWKWLTGRKKKKELQRQLAAEPVAPPRDTPIV